MDEKFPYNSYLHTVGIIGVAEFVAVAYHLADKMLISTVDFPLANGCIETSDFIKNRVQV